MNRILPLLFALVLSLTHLSAQQSAIAGRTSDSTSGQHLPFVSITVSSNGTDPIANGFSKEDGSFSIIVPAAGDYMVEFSAVGYNVKTMKCVTGSRLVAQLVILPKDLSAVTVTAQKKLVEMRPGMLVYNAAADLGNKGGTAADVLRKAPVLNVDAQGNVSMRGSSNLRILVNGKYSGQIARSAADALNMMPADMIQSVEIITTPSAKYDAEEAAGVINIITKKSRKDFTGALEVVAGNMEQVINPRIAASRDKWSIAFNGHIHRYRTKEASVFSRTVTENGAPGTELNQSMERDNTAPHGSGDLSLTFTPDSLTEWSFGSNFWFGRWPDTRSIVTTSLDAMANITEHYIQRVNSSERYLGADFNLGYTRKSRRPGQQLSLLAQYSPGRNRMPYDITLSDKDQLSLYAEINSNRTSNQEWTFQADQVWPLGKKGIYILDAGLKMISRNARNRYKVTADEAPTGDAYVPVPSRSDLFVYGQDVYSAYSVLKFDPAGRFYAEAGLRMERTSIDGRLEASGTRFSNGFTNLIPTATVSMKINEDQHMALSYTQRLTRPYVFDLNPNANASDPKNIEVGNPGLRPETTHQGELTYSINQSGRFFINTALFARVTSNAMIDLTQTAPDGVSTTRMENMASNRIAGLNTSYSFTLTPEFGINGNVNISYLDYSSNELRLFNEGWAGDISANASYRLPKRYTVQLFGKYDTRTIELQGRESGTYYYSAAVKKDLSRPRITLTFATVNPLTPFIAQDEWLSGTNFYSVAANRYYTRAFKLTVNWEFGKLFEAKAAKRVSNDDINDGTKK